MSDLLDGLWVEKYRPTTLEDVVLPDDQREFLNRCMEKGEIPHLLLIGPPGSGKTTVARIIMSILIKNEMDELILNGSDATGVDVMRNDIQGFLKSPPYESKMKIVYVDEFDYTTNNYQASMRAILELYSSNGRFLCTGNYLSKIIDPIQSRFQIFEMKSISEEFATKYCEKILKAENVEYDIDTVQMIVKNYIPDVRKAVNTLQKSVVDGKLKTIDVNSIISVEKNICGLITQICDDMSTGKKDTTINRSIPEIMKLISKGEPDYRGMYQSLSDLDGLPLWAKINVNQYNNKHQGCAIPSAHFMAMVYKIITSGMAYHKMFSK
jgi:DNA polymerase III delta prime subunit